MLRIKIMKHLLTSLLLLMTITRRANGVKTNLSYENMEEVFSAAVMHIRCYMFANPTMARYNQLFYEIKSIMQSNEALKGYVKVEPYINEHLYKALECQIKYEDSQQLARSCIEPPSQQSVGPETLFANERRPAGAITFVAKGQNKQNFQNIGQSMMQYNIKDLKWDPNAKMFPVLQLNNGLKVRLVPAGYNRPLYNANLNLQKQKKEMAQRLFAMKLSDCKKIPEMVEACLKTKEQKYTCRIGNQRISLKKLCNGEIDCNDGSDERSCYNQVADLLKNTRGLMYRLKKSLSESDCIEYVFGQYSELCTQISLLDHLDDDIASTIEDVVVSVSNVYSTLKELFCFRETLQEISANIKYEKYRSISPDLALIRTTCTCKYGHCLSSCLPICNITCERRQVLYQYSCSDGKATTIPITNVCDGFPDCDDQSDEVNCSNGNEPQKKITAQNILQTMLENLHKLITSHSNYYVLPQLIVLQKNIVELQRNFSKQFVRESINVKIFESLRQVFPKKMDTGKFSWDLVDELYDRLVSFNEDLLFVYKLAPSDVVKASAGKECPCVGGQCLQAACTRVCSSACALQGSLMYYSCHHSGKRIRLGAVCDGTPNCPDGDDEEKCDAEKCQSRHFYGILNNFRFGNEFDGNIGKALAFWKENVKIKIDLTLSIVTKPDHFDLVTLLEEALYNLTLVDKTIEPAPIKSELEKLKNVVTLTADKLVNTIKVCQ